MAKQWLFLPNGFPATNVLTLGWQTAHISNFEDGEIADHHANDFPDMELFATKPSGSNMVGDGEDNYLTRHCRIVEVYEGFNSYDFGDAYSGDTPPLTPWPDEVQQACIEALKIEDALEAFQGAEHRADGLLDEVQRGVLNALIHAKFEARLAELNTLVDAYRATCVEPTKLDEPEEVDDGPDT